MGGVPDWGKEACMLVTLSGLPTPGSAMKVLVAAKVEAQT